MTTSLGAPETAILDAGPGHGASREGCRVRRTYAAMVQAASAAPTISSSIFAVMGREK